MQHVIALFAVPSADE